MKIVDACEESIDGRLVGRAKMNNDSKGDMLIYGMGQRRDICMRMLWAMESGGREKIM